MFICEERAVMAYKVLVVDDESSNLHVMRSILQDQYTLIFAKSGERAIELTLKQRPDLILLDIMMPGMNGYEVCKRLKNEPSVGHIPIVIVSALDEYKSEVEGLKVGASDFLIKPVSAELVKSRVANLLGEARMALMRESYQLVMNQIASLNTFRSQNVTLSVPRIAKLCEWLSLKYGLTKVNSEDMGLAYPLCSLGGLWEDDKEGSSIESRSLSLLSEAKTGFAFLSVTLLMHKNTCWDGTGQPEIAGEIIPEGARIVAVAELLDREITKGEGDLKIRIKNALQALALQAGKIIDPRLFYLLEENENELCEFYSEIS